MKWLILLMLVACGKHQEPGALDYRDSDGDHVQNAYESDLDKYVANFEQLGNVSGELAFHIDKGYSYKFANEYQEISALKLIVANEARAKKDHFFSETSVLSLENTKEVSVTQKNTVTLHIKFDAMDVKPDELYLVGENENKLLGNWQPSMKIHLYADELKQLTNGSLKFSVKKKLQKSSLFPLEVDESIKEKTYRVHYFDGSISKVMYVAKSLEFSELVKLLNLPSPKDTNEDEIFFNSEASQEHWFSRTMINGDKVLVYSTYSALNDELLKNFDYQKKVISRENGVSKTALKLKNKKDARVYMRIKSPVQVLRTFVEGSEVRRHGHGGGGGMNGNGGDWYNCTHFTRSISKEKVLSPGFQNLIENLLILSNGKSQDVFTEEYVEKMDGDKVYWETKLENTAEQLELVLPTLNDKSFTVTGEYQNSCGSSANRGRGAAYKTNPEGQLSFEIETFVEKID